MNIYMAGIDHQRAGLEEREVFTFTATSLSQALKKVSDQYPQTGCVIIATCNRTELWLSGTESPSPEKLLLELKGYSEPTCHDRFVCREGTDAVDHLFMLAGGLRSQIIGENQILAQVKEALEIARKAKSIDTALDRLFLAAISCAKRIKTETAITRANTSAASAAVQLIESSYPTMEGLRCLIIGNGVIGRQTAELLLRSLCQVSITLRQHHQGGTIVPPGCKTITYDDRYHTLMDYEVIISATVSPHCTLTFDEVSEVWDGKRRLFIDLAVPRDIDPQLRNLPALALFDIDQLPNAGAAGIGQAEWKKIENIIHEDVEKYTAWYTFRNYSNDVDSIKAAAADEIVRRLDRTIRELELTAESREKLLNALIP
jgi:glutamyl-tRNA reductase